MPPIREYRSWNLRESDELDEVEPRRKYVFICEGSKTEVHYFKALIDRRHQLGLHPLIALKLWEKTDSDRGLSNPRALIRFAQQEKASNTSLFDQANDRMVIVFDLDIYCRVGVGRKGAENGNSEFETLRREAADNDILAVTNPSFELFLLLHSNESYERLVRPYERKILENGKVGKQRFVQHLFSENYGMNPKSNPKIGQLAEYVEIAIEEEKNLNQNLDEAMVKLTCNLGSIIDAIRSDCPSNDVV